MKINIKEITLFGMLGGLMYISKMIMEFLPNVHLIGTFIVAFTVVYRQKALFPIYIFVFITGLLNGFSSWWIPYLYVWTVLWGMTMLLPKKIPNKFRPIIYMLTSALHGFLYGTLYAPVHALLHGFNARMMVAWIVSGLPFDFTHGVSNFFCGLLIVPIISALKIAQRSTE